MNNNKNIQWQGSLDGECWFEIRVGLSEDILKVIAKYLRILENGVIVSTREVY